MITPVFLQGTPAPAGHYAPAVVYNGCVHVSGTLPDVAIHAAFDEQMTSLLQKCDEVLRAAGSARNKVISFTLYITNIENWDAADLALARFFDTHRLARTVLCVSAIRKSYAVQATLIAAQ